MTHALSGSKSEARCSEDRRQVEASAFTGDRRRTPHCSLQFTMRRHATVCLWCVACVLAFDFNIMCNHILKEMPFECRENDLNMFGFFPNSFNFLLFSK